MCIRKWQIILVLLVASTLGLSAEEGVHVLSRNETIYAVARRYGLTADALLSYNSISDEQARSLPVGFELKIPGTYVVQQGEYPFSIARKLEVNWLELLDANGLSRDDVVRPGDVLVVPGGGTSIASESREPVEPAPENTPSVVRPPAGELWPHAGQRRDYDGRFTGVVIDGSSGDEILSVTEGQVSYVGPFSTFGRIVFVQSTNGYHYVYMGAETILVDVGDRVEIGSPIGLVGYTPGLKDTDVLFTVWNGSRFVHPSVAPRG